jgi:hypothetical protein
LNKSYERFLPKEFLNQLGKGDVTKIKKGDAVSKKLSILEMVEALSLYNQEIRGNKETVKMGVGINYGDVMIGTLGVEDRLDGTVISDAVNIASRVENLTKALGGTLIITKEVFDNLQNSYPHRCIGKFLLKGKNIPMILYELLITPIDNEAFNNGILEFNSQNFTKSKFLFSQVDDKTSKYLQGVSEMYEGYQFDNWCGEIKIDKDGNVEKPENETIAEKKVKKLSTSQKEKLLERLTLEKRDEMLHLASRYFNLDGFIE